MVDRCGKGESDVKKEKLISRAPRPYEKDRKDGRTGGLRSQLGDQVKGEGFKRDLVSKEESRQGNVKGGGSKSTDCFEGRGGKRGREDFSAYQENVFGVRSSS